MKRIAVILITFLSLLLSGRDVSAAVSFRAEPGTSLSAQINDSISKGFPASLGREMCFAMAGGNAFSGNTTSHGGSVRLSQTGRRINPSTKTSFKIIKVGKVIDGRGYVFRGFSVFRLVPDLFSFNQHLHLRGILRLLQILRHCVPPDDNCHSERSELSVTFNHSL